MMTLTVLSRQKIKGAFLQNLTERKLKRDCWSLCIEQENLANKKYMKRVIYTYPCFKKR
jgi:hypothetical protein